MSTGRDHLAGGSSAADTPALPGSTGPETSGRSPARKGLPLWQETLLLVVIALGLAIVLKTFFVQAFYIPSDSMDNTLVRNDRILVEKVSYWTGDVQRGDVIVFDDPNHWLSPDEVQHATNPVTRVLELFGLYPTGGHLVKRVIGVGGDRVQCCTERGDITVNGVALHEGSYLPPGMSPSDQHFNVVVPAGKLWVMGDNRAFSSDSRFHLATAGGPFVPAHDVVGRAILVVWPLDHAAVLHRPATFADQALAKASAAASLHLPYLLGGMVAAPLLRWGRRRLRFAA